MSHHGEDVYKGPRLPKSNNHYDAGGIETINFIRAKLTPEQYKGYCLGNVLKYAARLNFKGQQTDTKKLLDYAAWLNDHLSAEKPDDK